jgi:excisionase family DNA binding protein
VPPNDTKPRPISEVARDLGVPRAYIAGLLKRGELDAIPFGRQRLRLVRAADVRELMTGTPPPSEKVARCNSLPAGSSARR